MRRFSGNGGLISPLSFFRFKVHYLLGVLGLSLMVQAKPTLQSHESWIAWFTPLWLSEEGPTQEPITVEASTKEQVEEAVRLKVKRILLDNMSIELLQEVLPLIPEDIETEASGNMTLERVRRIAELGVDYISVGAITHSAPSADVSLLFDWQ